MQQGLWPQGSGVRIPSLTLGKSRDCVEVVRRILRRCSRTGARQLPRHFLQVARANDVVAGKYCSAPVPWYLHRHTRRHTQVDHIPDGRSAEIMP
jgi:hypothetical protein